MYKNDQDYYRRILGKVFVCLLNELMYDTRELAE